MRMIVLILFLALSGCVTTGPTDDKTKMAEGYFQRGLAHYQERNYELALVEFHRSIKTDRSNKLAYYYLGVISDMQGKVEDALGYYREAISLDENFSEAYNAIGATYSKQKKWKEAIKYYTKALENKLYTTPHLPNLNIGRVYMAQKDYERAIEAFREAKRFAYQDFIIYELAYALLEAGKSKEAITEFQAGVALAPQNADLRYGLALAFLKNGNKNLAIIEFKKTVELAPKSEFALKANDYIKSLR